MSFIELTHRGFDRYGAAGTLRRAVRVIRDYLREGLHLSESHIWYFLKLSDKRPQIPLPDGFECGRAGEVELPLLRTFAAVKPDEARSRLALGAHLWLMRDRGRATCAFWAFHGQAPLRAVRGGWLTLPADVACLESAGTAAAYHDCSLAFTGWLRMAEREAQAGTRVILAKLSESDMPSRRAAENAGFVPLASMSFERICLYSRVRVYLMSGDPIIDFVIEQLAS